MAEDTTGQAEYLHYLEARFEGQKAAIAQRLRNLADDVENHEVSLDLKDKKPDYSRSARNILHRLTWGWANLGLDGLVGDCADTDRVLRHVDRDES